MKTEEAIRQTCRTARMGTVAVFEEIGRNRSFVRNMLSSLWDDCHASRV